MANEVADWTQEGRLAVWRYASPRKGWRGWHVSADPAGCRSVRNLLDRMRGGEPSHRTLGLELVTQAVLAVPNNGEAILPLPLRLRVEYRPELDALDIAAVGDRLRLAIGHRWIGKLSAAFADVERGGGDFGMRPSPARTAEPCWFWWWPGKSYHDGKRS